MIGAGDLARFTGDMTGLAAVLGPAALMVFLRCGAVVAVFPILGERSIPQRIRLVLALALSVAVLPAVIEGERWPQTTAVVLLPAAAAEVMVGLMLGIGTRLMVMALQISGTMIAQATSLSQIFGATAAEPQPAVGNLLLLAGLALAAMLGLHVRAVELLVGSYQLFPPGLLPAGGDVGAWAASAAAGAFRLAFALAAPFTAAALIYNIALGAINRAMPQLMVSFVGAPAITAGGLLLLLISLPVLLPVWAGALGRFVAAPFGGAP